MPGKESIVYCISGEEILEPNRIRITRSINFKGEFREIRLPWDIFQFNQWAIEQDVNWLSVNRKFSKISSSNRLMGEDRIFMERGAVMENCVVNATEGPVYIGKNATIMEGSLLRGPLSIGEGSTVKMGTRIYGATTIGPNCVVGGRN